MLFKDIDIFKIPHVLMLKKKLHHRNAESEKCYLEGTSEDLESTPCLKQDYCWYQNRSAMALSDQVLKTCKH